MTRRELLIFAAAGAFAMGWSIPDIAAEDRVVILGSGIGALTCTKYLRLYEEGIDVTVVDERSDFHAFDLVYEVTAIETGEKRVDAQLQHWFGKEAAREIAALLKGESYTPNLPYCGVAFGTVGDTVVRYDLKREGSKIILEKAAVEGDAAMVALRHAAVYDDVYM